ncbi:hypothetical protein SRB5_56000 [Streptomyces sp. RB5]|uniref:LTD domain-containing protein n=2 Tax=Streptomyces smaragdinus TaxID=2585196 RepID=A0A7K0CPL2_9ACTN|nr:hypothetical protein [Streptomyces smaragdinus]
MGGAASALSGTAVAAGAPDVKITEWEYNGSEFVEFTNLGDAPADMTGWSFSDSGATPGDVSLSPAGTIAAGESFLLSEASADAFRTQWRLADTVKVVGGNTTNLGRADAINLYDASGTLQDTLTYGDESGRGPRTDTASAWPSSADVIGADDAAAWTRSTVGDAESSWASTGGYIGSPGMSRFSSAPGTPPGDPGTPPGGVDCQTEAPTGSGPAVPGGIAWPGGVAWTAADTECGFVTSASGQDVSGLDVDPADPATLWAVKNKNRIYKLHRDAAGLWVPATDNGWGTADPAATAGKATVFADGSGQPDTEGITTADGGLFVTTERDNANKNVALDSVLRFDPNASGPTLTPTDSWDLTADFAGVLSPGDSDDANLGFEGITYVPDEALAGRFRDESTGAAYDPADYPAHGGGVFFLALEKNGHIYAYVLGDDGTSHRLADIATGMPNIADTQWDADNNRLWAVADNSSAGSTVLLKLGASGAFVSDRIYDRPAGLADRNLEGFVLMPDSTCVAGQKQVIRSDDGNNEGHSLWVGTIDCDLGIDTVAPTVVVKDGVEQTYETISFELRDAGGVDKAVLNGTVTDLSDAAVTSFDGIVRGERGAVVGENTLDVYDVEGNVTSVTFTLVNPHLAASAPAVLSTDGKNRVKAGVVLAVDAGEWTPGAAFWYRWLADGKPIATGATYELTGHERGKRVTVEVTGTLDGFQDTVRESAAVTVALRG